MKQKFSVEEQEEENTKPLITAAPLITHYKIEILGDYGDAEWAREVVEVIDQASQEDAVEIILASDGGNASGFFRVLEAIKNAECYVHCRVVGDIASAASFTMMACDSVSFDSEYFEVMFHGLQVSRGGMYPVNHLASDMLRKKALSDKLIDDLCTGFLTTEEITRIKDGDDLYLTAQEVSERWKKFKPEQEEIKEPNEEVHG